MSYELKLQLFLSGALAFVTYFAVKSVNRTDRNMPFNQVQMLPMHISVLLAMALLTRGRFINAEEIFQLLLRLLPFISVYYSLLLAAMPLCRKYLTPPSCVVLWLLPNFLYFYLVPGLSELAEPLTVIFISRCSLRVLGIIWLAGFTAVMVWKVGSHLWFRRKITASSREITDERILNLWNMAQAASNMDPWIYTRPVYSSAVTSPLSIGLWRITTLLVLPEKEYTPEELSLIFRHEIVHIERRDAANKLFLAFCTALCWFNPFMWKSTAACSADLELSCDQTVLALADHNTRQKYARLILDTAGDARGFTTCLSASAQSLRYRLKRILTPVSLHGGTFFLPLVTFTLSMSVGLMTISVK